MSPQLQKILDEIEQLSAEEQLEVISYATEQLKRRTTPNPVWQAYQASKQERQEVYRRLADA
jgi:pyruvate-formate lyase-activating enzyme